ncbi:MAG: hypothetical protein KDE51_09600 [Anaerolineales bacterium]|nr:hypothetical protein [Anaerolineales bacterium]
MIAYFLMVVLYLSLAVVSALESSFSSFQIVPWFNGMVWLRVHLITLGALTQILFAMLPVITAARYDLPRPQTRWDIWLTLNAGIMTLLVGIPMVSQPPIFLGGTLVFIATILLIGQLSAMRPKQPAAETANGRSYAGVKFYIAGLSYFLVGILIGTGLWLGWMDYLQVSGKAIEVHIHANNWGLMSLVFAGLLVDIYPKWAGRPLAYPQTVTPIFWLMTIGAFGLIFGPWLANLYLLVPGLVLHLTATALLLINMIKPLWGDRSAWTAGVWHLVVSYFWILAPVMVAPFVLLELSGVPGGAIEAMAPQALIYGWVLQFGIAIIPYFFMRSFTPEQTPQLGGNWLSFGALNIGGVVLWMSIFLLPWRPFLHGTAYLLWAVALVPVVMQLWQIVKAGLGRFEQEARPAMGD